MFALTLYWLDCNPTAEYFCKFLPSFRLSMYVSLSKAYFSSNTCTGWSASTTFGRFCCIPFLTGQLCLHSAASWVPNESWCDANVNCKAVKTFVFQNLRICLPCERSVCVSYELWLISNNDSIYLNIHTSGTILPFCSTTLPSIVNITCFRRAIFCRLLRYATPAQRFLQSLNYQQ